MNRLIRKQTHRDFRSRVKRVDPAFYRWGERANLRDATVKRPFGSVLGGFLCAYVVIAVANNRSYLESSLRQCNLSADVQGWIQAGLAALLAVSGIMLFLHLLRFFLKSGAKKQNSGALLMGVLGAMMLVYTPASVWQTGYGMLDNNSRSMLLTASA